MTLCNAIEKAPKRSFLILYDIPVGQMESHLEIYIAFHLKAAKTHYMKKPKKVIKQELIQIYSIIQSAGAGVSCQTIWYQINPELEFRTIQRRLKALCESGCVRMRGKGRATVYLPLT